MTKNKKINIDEVFCVLNAMISQIKMIFERQKLAERHSIIYQYQKHLLRVVLKNECEDLKKIIQRGIHFFFVHRGWCPGDSQIFRIMFFEVLMTN